MSKSFTYLDYSCEALPDCEALRQILAARPITTSEPSVNFSAPLCSQEQEPMRMCPWSDLHLLRGTNSKRRTLRTHRTGR